MCCWKEARKLNNLDKRTEILRKLYEEVLNDTNSHLNLNIKAKTIEDIINDSENNFLIRKALQKHINDTKFSKNVNTQECKTGLRKLISTSRINRKYRQSQFYNKIKRFSSALSKEESQLMVEDELQEKATQNEITPDISDENDTKSRSGRYNTEKVKIYSRNKWIISSTNPQKEINSAPLESNKVK